MGRLDAIDSALNKSLKIKYQSGKGNTHLVHVLFPSDTLAPIRFLCDKEIRSTVAEDNVFWFPSVNNPHIHVSGWHAVNNVSSNLVLTNRETITATKNRHRESTMFAMMDVPEGDRKFIYKHLGHSEHTNINVYQTPLASKELTVVGKRLREIYEGDERVYYCLVFLLTKTAYY